MLEGAYQNTSGVFYDTLSTVNGCDSVIITTLAVSTAPSSGTTNGGDVCQTTLNIVMGGVRPDMDDRVLTAHIKLHEAHPSISYADSQV